MWVGYITVSQPSRQVVCEEMAWLATAAVWRLDLENMSESNQTMSGPICALITIRGSSKAGWGRGRRVGRSLIRSRTGVIACYNLSLPPPAPSLSHILDRGPVHFNTPCRAPSSEIGRVNRNCCLFPTTTHTHTIHTQPHAHTSTTSVVVFRQNRGVRKESAISSGRIHPDRQKLLSAGQPCTACRKTMEGASKLKHNKSQGV